MKPFTLYVSALLLTAINLFAQIRIEKSASLTDIDVNGWTKTMLLENGNTVVFNGRIKSGKSFFYNAKGERGFDIWVFNKDRKLVGSSSIEGSWKSSFMELVGTYAINGEPVLFVCDKSSLAKPLYRLRFDKNNGSRTSEEKIADISRDYKYKCKFQERNSMHVVKDPFSNNYAVIAYCCSRKRSDDRINVMHFDGNHKLINSAYYKLPNELFDKVTYCAAYVNGNKAIYMYLFMSESRKDALNQLVITKLNSTDSVFVSQGLDFSKGFSNPFCAITYDTISGSLQLFYDSKEMDSRYIDEAVLIKNKYEHTVGICFIDAQTLHVNNITELANQRIVRTTSESDDEYARFPQYVNASDGRTVAISEDLLPTILPSRQYTRFGKMYISELDNKGKKINDYTISKYQFANYLYKQLYVSDRNKGVWDLFYSSYPVSFDIVEAPSRKYVIFNEDKQNPDVQSLEYSNGVASWKLYNQEATCYALNDGKAEKVPLAGSDNEKKMVFFLPSASYNARNNTYVTLINEYDRKTAETKIAWINFE